MHIAVLMGGVSSEREISVLSSFEITKALRELGHQVTVVEMTEGALTKVQEKLWFSLVADKIPPFEKHKTELALDILLAQLGSLDKVFIGLHGGRGENGAIQAELESLGIPFTGSGSLACALAMDKQKTKRRYIEHGLPTPGWKVVSRQGHADFSFPHIVKPNQEGSSVGMRLIYNPYEQREAIIEALKYDNEVLIEEYVDGIEYTVGVLGDQALMPGGIYPKGRKLFDYQAKYKAHLAEETFPPPELSEDELITLRDHALLAHSILGLRCYSRTDFIRSRGGTFYLLETNTLPGLTQHSLLPKSAQANGISFISLIERILG